MGQKHFPGAQKCKSTINQRGSLQEEACSHGRGKQAEEQTPEAVSPLMCQMVSTLPWCSEDMFWAAQGFFLGCSSLMAEEPGVGARWLDLKLNERDIKHLQRARKVRKD